MKNEENFLALGTVVVMKGTAQKVMIIQRAVTINDEGKEKYFDYGSVLYPEGLIKANVIYFTKEDIFEVLNNGYSDEDDKIFVKQLNVALGQYEELQQAEPEETDHESKAEVVDDPFAAFAPDGDDDDDPFASVRDMEDGEW
jgi:hypothetical protein